MPNGFQEGCIFCSIAAGQSPATIEFQNDNVIAFRDINPQAPVHVLIIPKYHVAGMEAITENDIPMLGEMFVVAKSLAKKLAIADDGYRLVINQGLHSGQIVDHLHLHLIGGRELGKVA